MQCVVLAGGLGTRLGALTATLPKALVPVAGRPFADHQLAWLAADGVTDVVYCIGHHGEQVRDFVGDGSRWSLRVTYVDEGEQLRGTAGALRLALDEGALEPAFGVLYGDSYLQVDAGAVLRAFEQRDCDVLMTVYRNEGRYDRSNAVLREDGSVLYDKREPDPAKAGMGHIDYGLSVIDRDRVVPGIPADEPSDLAEVYARLSREGRVTGYEVTERFYEVGSPSGIADLESRLQERTGV